MRSWTWSVLSGMSALLIGCDQTTQLPEAPEAKATPSTSAGSTGSAVTQTATFALG